jgi:hypothetical protein
LNADTWTSYRPVLASSGVHVDGTWVHTVLEDPTAEDGPEAAPATTATAHALAAAAMVHFEVDRWLE